VSSISTIVESRTPAVGELHSTVPGQVRIGTARREYARERKPCTWNRRKARQLRGYIRPLHVGRGHEEGRRGVRIGMSINPRGDEQSTKTVSDEERQLARPSDGFGYRRGER
jgi:hypothetical protein